MELNQLMAHKVSTPMEFYSFFTMVGVWFLVLAEILKPWLRK